MGLVIQDFNADFPYPIQDLKADFSSLNSGF